LEFFYTKVLNQIVPLDLDDPLNESTCCVCHFFSKDIKKHADDCVQQGLARVLSDLMKP